MNISSASTFARITFLFALALFSIGSTHAGNDKMSEMQKSRKPIGFLDFAKGNGWVLSFSDCTVWSAEEALPFVWFNRDLEKVKCFTLEEPKYPEKANEATERKRKAEVVIKLKQKDIIFYEAPTENSISVKKRHFDEVVNNSVYRGIGDMPKVFESKDGDWYLVRDGWIHLSEEDKKLVKFFPNFCLA